MPTLCNETSLSTCTNTTSSTETEVDPALVLALQVAGGVVLVVIMIAMGCTIHFRELLPHMRKPWGILIGFTSQYIFMPLIGFSLAHAFGVKASYAIGVLVISCCPGGTISNMYTYWTEGDVALSILMTTASTVLAFGMMPLTLFIYSRSWTSQSAVIPYLNIVQSLAAIVLPVFVGMYVRHKSQRVADIIMKICNVLTLLLIIFLIVLAPFLNPNIFSAPWTLYFMGFCMPIIGGLMGYLLGTIFNIPVFQRRTIAFETGLQNVPLASTLISLSFPVNDLPEYLLYPITYGVTMLFDGGVFVLTYIVWNRFKNRSDKNEADKKEGNIQLEVANSEI